MNTANIPQAALLLDIPQDRLQALIAAATQPATDARPPATLWPKKTARQRLGGISDATLNRMLRAGEIPHVQIGARVMLDPADVETFIRKAKTRKTRSKPGRPRAVIVAAQREQAQEGRADA